MEKMDKKSYIWKVGILRWGLPMFVLMTAVMFFLTRDLHPITLSRVISDILVDLLIWSAAGALFGYVMWRKYDRTRHE